MYVYVVFAADTGEISSNWHTEYLFSQNIFSEYYETDDWNK